ncbi:MAG: hypothetical protein R2909_16965 [Gemmatimonadales bacterium]
MSNAMERRRVAWCDRHVEWRLVAAPGDAEKPRNAVWAYELDGLTYYAFAHDPTEAETTTRQRALNWLNRHHLLIRREHLAIERVF